MLSLLLTVVARGGLTESKGESVPKKYPPEFWPCNWSCTFREADPQGRVLGILGLAVMIKDTQIAKSQLRDF